MTTISATIVLDSYSNQYDTRLTTIHLRYPRFIHSELMTHRVLSRNARSSRAVPVKKMIEEIRNDPVIPLYWHKNIPGMQGHEDCDEKIQIWKPTEHYGFIPRLMTREEAWLFARDRTLEVAEAFDKAGYHKQVVNRLLEPFMHIDTLVSSTNWGNFFFLRDHKDAEPHFKDLAVAVKEAMGKSEPRIFHDYRTWHLPYITQEEKEIYDLETLKKISSARCARISYVPFDGNGSVEKELERYSKLASIPLHASPMEHVAHPTHDKRYWGNFEYWGQFRKYHPNECVN